MALVRGRLEELPGRLEASLAAPLPRILEDRLVVTAIGQSMGPAELFAEACRARGAAAEVRPLSRFLGDEPPERGATLVVFSQGCSPNASLALRAGARFGRAVLVTAARAAPPGVEVARVPFGPEDGTLLRVVGPIVLAAAALRLAGVEVPAGVAEATREALRAPPLPLGPPLSALLAPPTQGALSAARALAWAWLEGTGRRLLAVDALELAHGPLQALWTEDATVVALESAGDPPRLIERAGAVLAPRHRLARWGAGLPPPWSAVEHLARGSAALVAELERSPRDLVAWPGRGADGPLYDLGGDGAPASR